MEQTLSYENIFDLVQEIQDARYSGEPYEEKLKLLKAGVTYPDVEALLWCTDQGAEYIAKRLFHHRTVLLGELSREELIGLVEQVMQCSGEEWEMDIWLDMITSSVADPSISDYIFWSHEDLSAEEIVDKALAYKPILL
ncbi:e9imm peptide [Paenibacillus ehimensis]|uniref:E9imm peptide n=1 Tax=Paenibacillus ehimensis TaxID=79264 RepID=A0ABT8VHB4_9BACL|nr:e9imm peptide [Paenibacillus ehimensis]MDO3680349.1 e9imm peptide [Paenibacillus ehimensis]MEC0211411.1 e9imm peptide [Paenibacillus ehimensis]